MLERLIWVGVLFCNFLSVDPPNSIEMYHIYHCTYLRRPLFQIFWGQKSIILKCACCIWTLEKFHTKVKEYGLVSLIFVVVTVHKYLTCSTQNNLWSSCASLIQILLRHIFTSVFWIIYWQFFYSVHIYHR